MPFSSNSGGGVVHSFGRLIPHHFPITDLQQISGPDGIGRIDCTLSGRTAWLFNPNVGRPTKGVTHLTSGGTATLVVNGTDSFENMDIFCTTFAYYFYLFPSSVNSKCSKTCAISRMVHCIISSRTNSSLYMCLKQ